MNELLFFNRSLFRNKFTTKLLLFLFLIINVYSLECVTYPISLDNITLCDNNRCFYTQLATSSIDLQEGNNICMEFQAVLDSNFDSNITISVTTADSEYSYDNCYFTDDVSHFESCVCRCPLSPNAPATCPCSAPNTPFLANQICISQSVSSAGCPFGGSSESCCKIGFSGTPRYYVCAISNDPSPRINFESITYPDGNTCTLSSIGQSIRGLCGSYNVSFTNIVFNSPRPGDFSVYDTTTGKEHFLNQDVCNSKNTADPNKFGAIKFDSNSTMIIANQVVSSIRIMTSNCFTDRMLTTYFPVSLQDVLGSKFRSSPADDLPIISTGVAFFDFNNVLNYVGTNIDGFNVMGPVTTVVEFAPNVNFTLGPLPDLCADPGSTMTPYFNGSCVVNALSMFTNSYVADGFTFGIITCPGVRYSATMSFKNDTTSGHYPLIQVCTSSIIITAVPYPGNGQQQVLTITPNMLYESFGGGVFARGALENPTSYLNKITTGSALISLETTKYEVKFITTTTKPILDDAYLNKKELVVSTHANFVSNCYIMSRPSVINDFPIKISQSIQEFKVPINDLVYDGPVKVMVHCGANSAMKNITISINQPPTSAKTVLNYSNWSVPWYYNLAKLSVIIVPVVVVVALSLFTWNYLKRPKIVNGKKFVHPLRVNDKFL